MTGPRLVVFVFEHIGTCIVFGDNRALPDGDKIEDL